MCLLIVDNNCRRYYLMHKWDVTYIFNKSTKISYCQSTPKQLTTFDTNANCIYEIEASTSTSNTLITVICIISYRWIWIEFVDNTVLADIIWRWRLHMDNKWMYGKYECKCNKFNASIQCWKTKCGNCQIKWRPTGKSHKYNEILN